MAAKHLPKLIDNIALHQTILNNNKNSQQIRILDCTFLPKPRDPKIFNAKFYGKFEEQVNENEPNFRDAYSRFLARSIPTSIHFNLGLATYPTPRDKFALYPPKIFQNYIQLLGINSDDHLVFYGRDALGGMLFAARAYWLFKAYSQSDSGFSILNGGLDGWIKAKLPTKIGHHSDGTFAKNRGNWTAKDPSNHFIEFNEFANNDENKLSENRIILDARPREQFKGFVTNPSKLFDSNLSTPTHLPGAINIPSNELVDSDGMMISPEKLQSLLENEGLNIGECQKKSMVTYCNAGNQASLLAAAMDLQLDFKICVFLVVPFFEYQTHET